MYRCLIPEIADIHEATIKNPGRSISHKIEKLRPGLFDVENKKIISTIYVLMKIKKARDGTRTRGLDLGKVALHQLSHSRISG